MCKMAHGDDIRRTSDTLNNQRVQNSMHSKGSKDYASPTFQQLLQCDDSKWSHISSQIKKKEDGGNLHKKKSVLAKVKETAKKLKFSLRMKKHSDTHESQCSAAARSSPGVGPKEKGEEDGEYHSARMYDFKQTPNTNKQDLVSITTSKHLEKLIVKQNKDENASIGNTTDPNSKINAPVDSSIVATDVDTKNKTTAATTDVSKLHEFPERNLRYSDLMVSESSMNKPHRRVDKGENMKGELKMQEKSVSVKEYLLHKFEPGEDERALSKVITQAISPRRDKMREAMSSFLKSEESSETNSSNVQENIENLKSSKSLPTSINSNTNTGSKNGPIKQSYSLGSNASKASSNLNQTFRSTFASYQDHFLSSSSNRNMSLNHSSTSSSTNTKRAGWNQSLNHCHASNANETHQDAVSSNKKVPSHNGATSVRRVPVSRGKQTHVPIHTTNRIDANATRTPLSTGDQDRFRV